MKFDIPEMPVRLRTTFTDPTNPTVGSDDAGNEDVVVTKPMRRSYTYPYPTKNQVLFYRKKINKPYNANHDENEPGRNEDLEKFTTISAKFSHADDVIIDQHDSTKKPAAAAILVAEDNGNKHKPAPGNKRKRLDARVDDEPQNVDGFDDLADTNKEFPKPQEVIEAVARKFQDDRQEDFTEDFVFIMTGSYYAAHKWRQHCEKNNSSKDKDLLSFADIDIFYSQPYQPKRSKILDRDSQKDSVAPGFIECYYRNLEINGRVCEVNYIRRVDLSISGGYSQLREFVDSHIDLNLVQAGAMVRLGCKGFELTDEYCSEAFEKFLDDPTHTVAIPDIANTDTPGNSLIRVLTKSTKLALPYELPPRSELARVDFTKRPLVQKFMEALWDLPTILQKEILDNFNLEESWSGEDRQMKLTTFSLKEYNCSMPCMYA